MNIKLHTEISQMATRRADPAEIRNIIWRISVINDFQ